MKVLVGCEFSGVVRDEFIVAGHDAVSCDLLPSEKPGPHIVGDLLQVVDSDKWDMLVFFWPCTNMAVSGARWFKDKRVEQARDIAAFKTLMGSRVPRVAGENPVSVLSSRYRKPDQIIQPWMFGHGETKATCLWLKNLPLLKPTEIVEGRVPRVHYASPGPDRWKERSRSLVGPARAMAQQWGSLC